MARRWRRDSALHVRRKQRVGDRSDRRFRHSWQRALQHEIVSRQADDQGRHRRFANAARRRTSRPRQFFDDLLLLPHVLDAYLLRLPSANDRQRAQAHASQRRPHHAQLHQLQFSSSSRRHLHARRRRHRHRPPHRPRAIFLRHPSQFAKCESRLALLHAANYFRSGVFRPGFQHVCSAHRARQGNQAMQRLPRLRRQRQQRLDGPAPACKARTS